jgi:hypothetical protein
MNAVLPAMTAENRSAMEALADRAFRRDNVEP